ncbi:hypothetical protein C8R44DRAFT_747896 [Mycena epipterygia]|nr:hypothetical protein C8R44DRAFT_747896 [Mycena epipterygia]
MDVGPLCMSFDLKVEHLNLCLNFWLYRQNPEYQRIAWNKDVMVDRTKIPVFQCWLGYINQGRGGSPQNAVVSCPPFKPSLTPNPAWLEALLFNAKMITTGADALPFPYVKGIFGTVVFLLEAVQKVKQNQESMKELCGDTVDIITVLRDQISAHGHTAALKFKTQCEELEAMCWTQLINSK